MRAEGALDLVNQWGKTTKANDNVEAGFAPQLLAA
jgi:hypothetical protein